ncbi:MAG: aminotransferase class V-fold PLP-dependent enzyme [Phycisphaerales bacterium]|nr:aminotransferase class V-fold PLP-dependent enzyme [Phycisphaerales bacterium]
MNINEAQRVITDAVGRMGPGALSEEALVQHIHPLFSRVLARNEKSSEIYLANHSLGRPMDMVSDLVQGALDGWYEQLDGVWNAWLDARDRYRAEIAAMLCWPDERAVVPKTSAAQGLRAVLNAVPVQMPSIVSTECEFDSIDFVLKAYHDKERAFVRWVKPDKNGLMQPETIIKAISSNTDVVVLSAVCFATGQVVQSLKEIIDEAHEKGAIVVLDAYHAFGVLPLDFAALGADFIIGGNYKYTRGGAGACYLAVHPRHLDSSGGQSAPDSISPIDTGWFAKREPFSYKRSGNSLFAPGGDAWLEATPPVLTYYQALPGLMLTNTIGVDRLRAYSRTQQKLLADQLEANGVTPLLLKNRGAYILIEHHDGREAVNRLKASGINADARPLPGTDRWVVRLCPDLLNTNAELEESARRIAKALA